MLKGFSWIIASIAMFFLGLAIYALHDESEFWRAYFYIMSSYVGLIGLAFNLKKKKTSLEMSAIVFFLVYRILLILYFIIFALILKITDFMNSNIVFLIIFGLSAAGGWIYAIRKNYERKS